MEAEGELTLCFVYCFGMLVRTRQPRQSSAVRAESDKDMRADDSSRVPKIAPRHGLVGPV